MSSAELIIIYMSRRGFREILHYFSVLCEKAQRRLCFVLDGASTCCRLDCILFLLWRLWSFLDLLSANLNHSLGTLELPEDFRHCTWRMRCERLAFWNNPSGSPVGTAWALPRLSYQDCVFPEQTSLIVSYLVQGASHPNQRCCLDSHWLVWVSQFKEKLQKQRQK